MAPGESVPVLPFFNLVMVWNPGISYGLFPASGRWEPRYWSVFSLAAVVGLGLVAVARRPAGSLAIGLGW